jgi:lipoprotein NlpI
MMTRLFAIASVLCAASCSAAETPQDTTRELKARLDAANAAIAADPDDVGARNERGDALFFLGRYGEAVADYDRVLELRPELAPKHWQRGLALYFAGRYDESAKQFERYYEGTAGDKSDRENGIWRFYAQVKKDGVDKAREQLLEYTLPDREPLPIVYRMCAGEATPAEVLKSVESAKVSDDERAKRRFYADLYVGLDATIVRDDRKSAKEHLQ